MQLADKLIAHRLMVCSTAKTDGTPNKELSCVWKHLHGAWHCGQLTSWTRSYEVKSLTLLAQFSQIHILDTAAQSSIGHYKILDALQTKDHEFVLHIQHSVRNKCQYNILSHASKKRFVFKLTKLELVLLLSSSGMGRNTARAIQFAKMVNKMMISKVLDRKTQDRNNKT